MPYAAWDQHQLPHSHMPSTGFAGREILGSLGRTEYAGLYFKGKETHGTEDGYDPRNSEFPSPPLAQSDWRYSHTDGKES